MSRRQQTFIMKSMAWSYLPTGWHSFCLVTVFTPNSTLLGRAMKRSILVLSSLLVVACASAPPTLQTGPDAERTFDGLVRVDNSRFRDAWADPEVDFSSYNKVMPGGARFEFRAVSKTAGRTSFSLHRNNNHTLPLHNHRIFLL